MKRYRRRKWMMLAAMLVGTATQLSTCREQSQLFGLRTVFSAFTLPIDTLIRQFFVGFQ